ncbi:MAG: Asp-tRNA(Asn)/Glu-tRNA(Gln) amidotransferase subunit GatB [Caldisericia bacterium]|nr:Asp-tRNA(Asn)/Glu-tRNA(Gln) amidotransferase subunit GatB [Caldisericia bacterium]MDD5690011.1 Asp-tRNA(Asn)/Glu-tRNA(Gln) amidotransferase subunit GatB [Caldisericia bacterium]
MFRSVIGLEIHIQLLTKSKMFCSCPTNYGAPPNSNICEICLGYPGTLPVVNKEAVKMGIMLALSLDCKINNVSSFYRKNYFYPDLPKGYQITQFDLPLSENGLLSIEGKDIRIRRIHLEEDSAKLIHREDEILVDFNRCGIPLIELVTEPDIASPEEAGEFLEKLKEIVDFLGISSGKMEEGALRCDVNVSLKDVEGNFGTKVEIKNLNSFREVMKAIKFEIERQSKLLEKGECILSETRAFNEKNETTILMRSKETLNDYRYFPEPDLLLLSVKNDEIEKIRTTLPELPHNAYMRLIENFGLSNEEAKLLTSSKDILSFFDGCTKLYQDYKTIVNWISSEILKNLNKMKKSLKDVPLNPENFIKMLTLINEGKISGKIGKTILEEMMITGKDPVEFIKEKGLFQLSDSDALVSIIEDIINNNPKEVSMYRNGKKNLFGFFMGEAMKKTNGKANPQLLKEIMLEKLEKNG